MIMNSCEIWHWGVKGMKWGVRRYRNADGSLTSEGVRKYRKSYNDIKNTQKLAERSKTVNSTGISALDSYNNKYYEKAGTYQSGRSDEPNWKTWVFPN